MSVYDIFYETAHGTIANMHQAAFDAEGAADVAADLIRDGSPDVRVEVRRSPQEIEEMPERRSRYYARQSAAAPSAPPSPKGQA